MLVSIVQQRASGNFRRGLNDWTAHIFIYEEKPNQQ